LTILFCFPGCDEKWRADFLRPAIFHKIQVLIVVDVSLLPGKD
jgi:hypothetical protein